MQTYSKTLRILFRIKLVIDGIVHSWNNYVSLKMSRDKANRLRNVVIEHNGRRVVDGKLMKKIRRYCKDNYGSSSYWPWLALYSEIRGEFKEGWMPYDYYRFEFLPTMNPEKYMRFSEVKILDHRLFKNYIIEPLFYRANGQYFDKNENIIAKSDVKKILKRLNEEIVIKPESGRGGQGIFFMHSKDFKFSELALGTNVLIQKVVKQHKVLNKLYPHSINTFRVSTLLDNNGKIIVKFIIIRFGVGGSRIDNASNGGGWIFTQLNGKLDSQAYDRIGIEIGTAHPDTGARFSEIEITYVDKIIDFCKMLHRNFPYNRIIGWDVYIDEYGEPKLIEWNANNPMFWQVEACYGPIYKGK